MKRYVRQSIEATADGKHCSPYCFFFSANKGNPICWLGYGYVRIQNGERSLHCLAAEEKNDE